MRPWEIVDINFGKSNNPESKLIIKLNQLYREKKWEIARRHKVRQEKEPDTDKAKEKRGEQIKKMDDTIQALTEEY